MEETAAPPALSGSAPDDPRLDFALQAALGPEPAVDVRPTAGGPSAEHGELACSEVDERLERATDALLEEVRRVEEQAQAAAVRAEQERRRRKKLRAGLAALALLALLLGTWGRVQRQHAKSEAERADQGWDQAQAQGELKRAETDRADEGWAEAERQRARADRGWTHAAEETARADAGWARAEEETKRADEGWTRAAEEAERANNGWAFATLESERARTLYAEAQAESARAEELGRQGELLALLRASAQHRAAGDFAAAEGALQAAEAALERSPPSPEQLGWVAAERAQLERDALAGDEARARAERGAEIAARVETALARAALDGAPGSQRAELIAAAFAGAGLDPLAADADAAVGALAATGRGQELAGALLAFANAEAGAGRTERCAELAARAVQLAGGPAVRAGAAEALLAAGLPAEAAAHLEALCALFPESRGARERLARARFACGDAFGAAGALRAALELGPLSPAEEAALRGRLGRALRRAGELEGSQAELEAAAALAPDLDWIALELAATRLACGDSAGALAILRDAFAPQ